MFRALLVAVWGAFVSLGVLLPADASDRLSALSKLRELPFSAALMREPAELAHTVDLPRQPGATLFGLADGLVLEILAPRNLAELRAAFGLLVQRAAPF